MTRKSPNDHSHALKIEAIQREMKQARESMDQTLDELHRRLSPRRIAHDALDDMKKASTDMYRTAMNTIKDHPIPTAIAGFALALVIGSAVAGRARRNRRPNSTIGQFPDVGPDGADGSESINETAGNIFDRATHAATSAAHSAKQTVSRVAESVREHGNDLAHTLNETRHKMQRNVRHGYDVTRDSLEHSFHDHPLLIGAGVFSAGLALGAILPSTRQENQWVGEYRDRLVDATKDRLTRAARTAKDTAADAARRESLDDPKHLIDDIRRSASGGASVKVVGEEVGRRAGAVVGEALQAAKEAVANPSSSPSTHFSSRSGSDKPPAGEF